MKKWLFAVIFSLVLGIGSSFADVYMQVGASYLLSSDFDNEFNWSYLLGYEFNENHAVEIESGIYGFDDDRSGFKAEYELTPILINYRYSTANPDKLNYFAGFGAGVSVTEFDLSPTQSGEDAVFTGQGFGGLSYEILKDVLLLISYKLMYFDEANESDFKVDPQFVHGPELSLRYTF